MEAAIVSVAGKLRDDQVTPWFEAVSSAHQESEEDWTRFKQLLMAQVSERSLPPEALETFVEHMDIKVSDQRSLLSEMNARKDELPRLYEGLLAKARESRQDSPTPWDGTAAPRWYAHLTQVLGNGWPGWSGKEEEWDRFKAFFLGYADQAGVRPQAQLLLDDVERAPDKIEGFAGYGIAIATHEQLVARTKAPDLWSQYEPKAWYATLTKGWGGWSGREADWAKFKRYFLKFAQDRGVGEGAGKFLDLVEAAEDKRAAFAEHGITLPDEQPAEPGGEIAEKVAERDKRVEAELAELVEASEEQMRQAAEELEKNDAFFEKVVAEIMEKADFSEFEGLTSDEIQEIWEEALLARIQEFADQASAEELRGLTANEAVSGKVKAILPEQH